MTSVVTVRGARLLLDADVLVPIRICDFILTASTNGLFQRPIVSEQILAEAIRNVIADLPDLDEARVQRRFANVTRRHGRTRECGAKAVRCRRNRERERPVPLAAAIFHIVDFGVTNERRLRREVTSWAAVKIKALVARSAD